MFIHMYTIHIHNYDYIYIYIYICIRGPGPGGEDLAGLLRRGPNKCIRFVIIIIMMIITITVIIYLGLDRLTKLV